MLAAVRGEDMLAGGQRGDDDFDIGRRELHVLRFGPHLEMRTQARNLDIEGWA
ncbi:MAG TPA: hypothetical protein VJQ86_11775 [Rhodanobacteraceae bacterium]|nr:hypothetical protein [Rhodanobacteraceae bacterium]